MSPALARGFFTTEPPLTASNNLAVKSKYKTSLPTTVPSFHVAAISQPDACYYVTVTIPSFCSMGPRLQNSFLSCSCCCIHSSPFLFFQNIRLTFLRAWPECFFSDAWQTSHQLQNFAYKSFSQGDEC